MASRIPTLTPLDPTEGVCFCAPTKRINDGDDVKSFLASRAYADIMTFIFQLNTSMLPRKFQTGNREWKLNDVDMPCAPAIKNLAGLLDALASIIEEAPPDPGPRRFGNASFRMWHNIVQERISRLLDQHLPPEVLAFRSTSDVSVRTELEVYLTGSFGSSQRLDYGTGHELSFLAFLACLWKLGAFPPSNDGDQERSIVLAILEPYFVLVRRLILTYTLEPAGSHGVWGLDDHFFLSYIFGSAQFAPPVSHSLEIAIEGSLDDTPRPADIVKMSVVERERKRNMYFSAIGFIYDVKKGPFWEHSPILYDVSGVTAGWAKINKGMIKMYNAEVLSKFPVVQHFSFGSLLMWEKDLNAKAIEASIHTSSQPKASNPMSTSATTRSQPSPRNARMGTQSKQPQSLGRSLAITGSCQGAQVNSSTPSGLGQQTQAPWALSKPYSMAAGTRNDQSTLMPSPGSNMASSLGDRATPGHTAPPMRQDFSSTTRAPWADKR